MALSQEKKGGPYSKDEREKRQNEVYRLHIEYGYSALQIAKMMRVNRNTINNDIKILYSKLSNEKRDTSDHDEMNKQFARIESHRVGLRNELDKDTTLQERLITRKTILNLDLKIISVLMKIRYSKDMEREIRIHTLNKWMAKNGYNERFISYENICSMPKEMKEKVFKMLEMNSQK